MGNILQGKKINTSSVLVFLVLFLRLHAELAGNDYFFLMAIGFSLAGILIERKISRRHIGYIKWQLTFYAFYLLSILWADDPAITRINLIATFGRCIIMMYISVFLSKRERIYQVLDIYVAVTVLIELYLLLLKGPGYVVSLRNEDLLGRMAWNSNLIGLTVAIAVFFAYFRYIQSNKALPRFNKQIYVVCMLAGAVLILLSGSKKAIFALFFLVAGLYFITHEKNRFFYLLLVVACSVLAYIAIIRIPALYRIIGQRIQEFVYALLGKQAFSTSDRTRNTLIRLGVEWFKEKPVLGHGMAGFKSLFGNEFRTQKLLYAHNNYLEIAVGGGIVGLIIYYIGYLRILRNIKWVDAMSRKFILLSMVCILVLEYGLVSYLVEQINLLLIICYTMTECAKCDAALRSKAGEVETEEAS